MGKTAAVNENGMADTRPARRKNMASNKEVLGHALGGVGQNTVYALWSGFITAFYTDEEMDFIRAYCEAFRATLPRT